MMTTALKQLQRLGLGEPDEPAGSEHTGVAQVGAVPKPTAETTALSDSDLYDTKPLYGGQTTTPKSTGPVLVLGATGSFGSAVTTELADRGIAVRAVTRDGERAWARFGDDPNVNVIRGDVFDVGLIEHAMEGCEAVVHGLNFPAGKWETMLLRSTEAVVSAAERTGTLIVFPGSVHALGRQTNRPLPETTPLQPADRYGHMRTRVQDLLESAANDGRVRTIVIRTNDLFGPTVRNSIVDGIFQNALMGKPMTVYGKLNAAHQWAYMPDVARVVVAMLVMARSAHCFDRYEIINASGHIMRPQRQFLELVAEGCGSPCKIDRKSWAGLRLSGLGKAQAREMAEMRHLWDEGVLLDGDKLLRLFPQFEPTPLPEAIATTLASYRV